MVVFKKRGGKKEDMAGLSTISNKALWSQPPKDSQEEEQQRKNLWYDADTDQPLDLKEYSNNYNYHYNAGAGHQSSPPNYTPCKKTNDPVCLCNYCVREHLRTMLNIDWSLMVGRACPKSGVMPWREGCKCRMCTAVQDLVKMQKGYYHTFDEGKRAVMCQATDKDWLDECVCSHCTHPEWLPRIAAQYKHDMDSNGFFIGLSTTMEDIVTEYIQSQE